MTADLVTCLLTDPRSQANVRTCGGLQRHKSSITTSPLVLVGTAGFLSTGKVPMPKYGQVLQRKASPSPHYTPAPAPAPAPPTHTLLTQHHSTKTPARRASCLSGKTTSTVNPQLHSMFTYTAAATRGRSVFPFGFVRDGLELSQAAHAVLAGLASARRAVTAVHVCSGHDIERREIDR